MGMVFCLKRTFIRSIKKSCNFLNKYKKHLGFKLFLKGKQTIKIKEVVKILLEMCMNQVCSEGSLKIKHIIMFP
jgi:hypothetical protein